MARIKINDLPELTNIEVQAAKGTMGGALMEPTISRDEFSPDVYLSDKSLDGTITKDTYDATLKKGDTILFYPGNEW